MQVKHRTQLPELMKELGLPMTAVEIGVAEGFNSADLLRLGIEKLYSVDVWRTVSTQKGDAASDQAWHHNNYVAALNRLAPYGEKSIVLRGFSEAMSIRVPDNSLGLVYLDGDHSYEGVFKDLAVWFPKLVDGGICAGHDFLQKAYGVKRAVEDFTNGKFKVHVIPENKDEDAGFYFINK